jgi:integrase
VSYPQELLSTGPAVPTGGGLLEPSIADAIATVMAATDLLAQQRTHWVCSLRQIAKALDAPPESLAARWSAIRFRVGQLHHAQVGIERKTLANHVSNLKAALAWFGNEQGLPKRGAPLMPEWQALRAQLKDPSRKAKLSGLIRYCSLKGIVPDAVDEAVVDDYMRYRADTTALAVDIKARRAIARAWNSSIGHIAGWPANLLIEPPLKTREGPHWVDFPDGLQRDVAAYLAYLAKPRRAVDGKRLSPCKPSTLRTKRNDLVAFAKQAVRSGTPIEDLTSFAALLNPDVVTRTLEAYWQEDGKEPGTFTIDLPKKLIAAARATGCLDAASLDALTEIRANLEQHRRAGLTEKNRKLVREVLTGDVWRQIVKLPRGLMAQARSANDHASMKAAVTAQLAVAIGILTPAPVRIGNLAAVRLGENLIKPGGPKSPYWLVFPHYDVKNRVDLNFPLSMALTELIDEYIHVFRPRLIKGADEGWLFPSPEGGHKSEHLLSLQIKDRVKKETGLSITAHQFRHACAAIFLKHNPGQHELLRRILGHTSVRTTTNFYSGLETIQATETFGRIIEGYLDLDDDGDEGDE